MVAMFAGCVGYAAASDYPSRPIRLVVGFTAGGPTDIAARFIAERLGPALGEHVIVENRLGAASTLAPNDVMSQPREDYDLLACIYFDSVTRCSTRISAISSSISSASRCSHATSARRRQNLLATRLEKLTGIRMTAIHLCRLLGHPIRLGRVAVT